MPRGMVLPEFTRVREIIKIEFSIGIPHIFPQFFQNLTSRRAGGGTIVPQVMVLLEFS